MKPSVPNMNGRSIVCTAPAPFGGRQSNSYTNVGRQRLCAEASRVAGIRIAWSVYIAGTASRRVRPLR